MSYDGGNGIKMVVDFFLSFKIEGKNRYMYANENDPTEIKNLTDKR